MDKSGDAYRTISEAAEELDLPQHVLRFWETRFPQIRPMKRGGGRRYYRPDDLELLRAIRHLLYDEGYTIRGVQRMLKEQGARGTTQLVASGAAGASARTALPPVEDAGEPEEIYDIEGDGDGEIGAPAADGDRAAPALPAPVFQAARMAAPMTGPMAAPMTAPAPAAAFAPPRQGLPAEARRTLESVLADLDECRRILAAARA